MKKTFIFMAALLTVKLLAGDWTVETVATLADSCKGLGFTLDDNNWPHIVYAEKHTDSASVQEKYRDAEGIWQGPYDTNCPHSENMAVYGPWNCVAFDAKNDTFWVITIYGLDNVSYLCASYKDGISSAWTSGVQVKSNYGTWPARYTACAVAVESGRVVHLVYSDYNDTTIYYIKRTASGWGTDENIGGTGMDYGFWYYYGISIALDGITPHIAGYFYNDDPTYYDILPSYRNKAGGSWGTRIRMSNWGSWPGMGGGYVSLALNPMGNDYDWACWGNPEGERYVRYGQRSVSGWTGTSPVTPVDMGSGGFSADIAGFAGMVWLAYRDNNGDLKFARYETMGSPTDTQTVDTEPTSVSNVCLKMDSDGGIHIAYFAIETGSYRIKYAYSPGVGVQEEGTDDRFRTTGISVYPNPFNGKACMKIVARNSELKKCQLIDCELNIYDIFGRFIRSLTLSALSSEFSTASWDGRDLQGQEVRNGVYFIKLQCKGVSGSDSPLSPLNGVSYFTKKIVLLR